MKLKRPLYGDEKGGDVLAVQRALNRWADMLSNITLDGGGIAMGFRGQNGCAVPPRRDSPRGPSLVLLPARSFVGAALPNP